MPLGTLCDIYRTYGTKNHHKFFITTHILSHWDSFNAICYSQQILFSEHDIKERQGVISAALAIWETVVNLEALRKRIEVESAYYYPYLPTTETWLENNELPSKTLTDGRIGYYIGCEIKDYVKIMYKK